MPSPSAAGENIVVYCASLRGTLSVSLYVGQICLICHLSCLTICTMDSDASYVLIPLPKNRNAKLWRYLRHTKENKFINTVHLLWLPYVIGQTIIFSSCGCFHLSSSFFYFSLPNLSGRRLDVYHTSTIHIWCDPSYGRPM